MTFTPLQEALALLLEKANDSVSYITENLHEQARNNREC